MSGISQVIDYLVAEDVAKCIASNGLHEHIMISLDITKLDKYFSSNRIFSASMVKHGKPMPDLFLHAAKKMEVDTANCMVIEDSVVGIMAAKAAKMPVIGFLGGSHAKSNFYRKGIIEACPNMIANDAMELLEMLKG